MSSARAIFFNVSLTVFIFSYDTFLCVGGVGVCVGVCGVWGCVALRLWFEIGTLINYDCYVVLCCVVLYCVVVCSMSEL